ncbi:MAG: urea transporter [Alphaproteobacteria bacterium]
MIKTFLNDLIRAYGALYLVGGRVPALLLVAATLLDPVPGFIGLAGGAFALAFRRALALPAPAGNLDVMNAVFVSLALAKTMAPGLRLLGLVMLAVGLTVLVMQMAERTLRDHAGLPVLSLPFVLITWMMTAIGFSAGMVPQPVPPIAPAVMPVVLEHALATFGALYFSPTWIGGALVVSAFLLSSPILTGLGLAGYVLAELTLIALTGTVTSPLRLLVGSNGIVVAMLVGGILAVPRAGQFVIAGLAVLASTLLAVALTSLLSVFWLTAMSLPCITATYLAIIVFRGPSAPAWATHWTTVPVLPEILMDRAKQAEIRGVAPSSVALCLPYTGHWDVYQGFDGPHTHQGPWRYGVDFIKIRDGQSYLGTGERLEDYLCYGEAVVSPAFGTVVSVRSDIADNRPGEVNTDNVWGNHVMIAVAGGLYVVIAHLQPGSVVPAIGTFVYPGMVVGRCGNSGRSPQPHIHMHVQDTALLGAPTRRFHLSNVLIETPSGPEFSVNLTPKVGQRLTPSMASTTLREALRPRVGRTAGYKITVPGKRSKIWTTAVELDLAGRFLLRADSDASVVLYEGPLLLALDERTGGRDPLLDMVSLALGVTPFAEDATCWRDAQPISALPLPLTQRALVALLKPFGGALDSRYSREWRASDRVWLQTGRHAIRVGPFTLAERETQAEICDADGLVAFRLLRNGKALISARLAGLGRRADIGIPAWSVALEPTPITLSPTIAA